MSTVIKDKIQLQLIINDRELDLSKVQLDFCHVSENVRLGLPAMTMQLKDTIKFFSAKNILLDGASIRLSVGIENKKVLFQMRLFSLREIPNATPTYRIYAYLDAPRYWSTTTSQNKKGTASSVLEEICDETEIQYDGVNTYDDQIWVPGNKKYRDFAKTIVQHAYIDDNSCCQMGITSQFLMRMLNVTDFLKFPVQAVYSNTPAKNQREIGDWTQVSKSGVANSINGYQDTMVSQSTLREDVALKDLNVKKNTTKISMNTDVKAAIGQSRVRFNPIDSGNVNENYYRARYQNDRLASLFSYGIEFVTESLVNAELLDVINLQISRPGAQNVSVMSGLYMITGKVFYIVNDTFYQKLEVYRHGVNDKSQEAQTQT